MRFSHLVLLCLFAMLKVCARDTMDEIKPCFKLTDKSRWRSKNLIEHKLNILRSTWMTVHILQVCKMLQTKKTIQTHIHTDTAESLGLFLFCITLTYSSARCYFATKPTIIWIYVCVDYVSLFPPMINTCIPIRWNNKKTTDEMDYLDLNGNGQISVHFLCC